jgi:DNA-binding transcriptional MerR regulator/methylmalonyl-CoA mutase cobalamin-binding subunit
MGADVSVETGMSIKDVSQLLGLPIPTIRSWERRYGFPAPQRTAGQHRRYGGEELRQLRALRDEIARGRSVSEAVEVVRERARAQEPSDARITQLIDRWRAYDGDAAKILLDEAAEAGLGPVIQEILLPALRQVGEMWQSGSCDVAEEHYATAQARSWLLGHALPPSPRRRVPGSVILACGPEELHTIGIDAFATLLVRKGFNVKALGAMTPSSSLVTAIRATGAQAAVVTCQRSVNRRATVRSLASTSAMSGLKLFYAGNAFATSRARAGVPGTYLGDDMPKAVEIVEKEVRELGTQQAG